MNEKLIIQSLSINMTPQLLVSYAGATWDFHRYHYDSQFAKEKLNVNKPIVDGQMFGAIIAKHLISELGQNASIVKMKLRYLSMVMIDETVKFDFDVINSRLVDNMTVLNVLINVKVEKDNRDVLKPVEVEIKL
ncbi:MAG: hypothetical protein CL872_05650 [Dehalococcoidaceae bacterium]|nr:hypothetical protein [Dehalococcoidaceae bacterium]